MSAGNKNVSRKKFLLWGIGISSVLSVPALFRLRSSKKEEKTTKMLTKDGRLVEVRVSDIPTKKKKKVDDKEILTWLKTNKRS